MDYPLLHRFISKPRASITFVGTNHCILGTPHKSFLLGDTLTQLFSHYDLPLIMVTQILVLANFLSFQDFNFITIINPTP